MTERGKAMLIAELVFAIATLPALIGAVVGAVVNTTLALVSIVVELTARVLGVTVEVSVARLEGADRAKDGASGEGEREAEGLAGRVQVTIPPAVLRWSRRLGLVAGMVLIAMLVTVAVLNTFFFEATASRLIHAAGARSGIDVSFEKISGDLFAGRFEAERVRLVREEHGEFEFDVQADRLVVDLKVLTLARRNRQVAFAEAIGLRGDVERLAGPDEARQPPWFARRTVRIEHLHLREVDLVLTDRADGERRTIHVEIATWDSQPVRSRWVWFDTLFATNAHGEVDGAGFAITNVRSASFNRTDWNFTDLSAEAAGVMIGGPLNWLDQGVVDIGVSNRWSVPGELVEMDWEFILREPHATVPADVAGLTGRVVQAGVRYINEHDELPLMFTVRVDSSGFEGGATPEAAGFWRAIRDAFLEGIAAEAVHRDEGDSGFRRLLDRVRPEPED